ncbi:superoxide dismutase family protein [Azospirillum picis]|uniref:Superoxide dismutase [Cu-Zn] n=1 Tax=Azospirillum picis TaxID=488438 RepID=A0ABU0MPF0_9PROT|nr:superoxide dismutase family protein [Azospirillum picis]MBP2301513.1 Cu-Zn family superoxide dismutase [Azospirillum picis]MDQ0535345.1 Cu-Zn family superoxide dismutase [Azospirillum picis]
MIRASMTPALLAAGLTLGIAALAAPAAAQQAAPAPAPAAQAAIADAQGKPLGTVTFTKFPHGILVHGQLEGLPPGWHGIHIHENGACTPNFAAAGGHFGAKGSKHGLDADPMHYGELPNIWVDQTGKAGFEAMTHMVSLGDGNDGLFKQGGTAIVVHAQPDDYLSQPAGNSGDRIACGVIGKS